LGPRLSGKRSFYRPASLRTFAAGAHKGRIRDVMSHSHLGTASALKVRRQMRAETDVPLQDRWTEVLCGKAIISVDKNTG